MKEKMSKLSFRTKGLIIAILVLILVAVMCPSIFASSTTAHAVGYNNYIFKDYHVDIEFDYQNRAHIKENMTVEYGPASNGLHKGIVRAIPQITTISKSAFGKSYHKTFMLDIYDIKANELYDYYFEDSTCYIELGGNNYINVGSSVIKNYTVSYIVDIGDDFTRDFDFVFYNVIGTDYPVPIENATFNVTLPKNTDNNFEYFVGKYKNETPLSDFSKTLLTDGRVVYSLNNPVYLDKNEGITVKMKLEEGYFKGLSKNIKNYNITNIMLVVGCSVFTVLVLMCFISFSMKRKNLVETVEFYPPDDLTPPDTQYLLNGVIDSSAMSSLFVYWASKGIVKIELDENKKPIGIRKVNNIPEHFSDYEKVIFNKMFENSEYVDLTSHDDKVANTIFSSIGLVKQKIGARYSKRSTRTKAWSCGISVLLMVIGFVADLIFSRGNALSATVFMVSLITGVGAGIITKSLMSKNISNLRRIILVPILAFLLAGFVCANIFLGFLSVLPLYTRIIYFVPLMVCIGFMGLADEYSDKWRETIGKIYGFKHNLEIVEADKLKKLVDNDPEYFYNILPYAYAFGITKKFIKKFENITIPYNDYYGGSVDVAYLIALNSSLNSYSRVSSSSGGSFSGGGGGVGGGFGGGGSFGR